MLIRSVVLSVLIGCSILSSGSVAAAEDLPVEGFWNKFVCIGAGTCYRDSEGELRKACSGGGCSYSAPTAVRTVGTTLNPSMPTTIITNTSTYVVVPNYSGGIYPSAVISTGK